MKDSYKIPSGLDASFLDVEIAIKSPDGVGVRPLPVKLIGLYLLSGLACIYLVMNSFVRYGTLAQKVLFIILWVMLTMLLCKYDSTHRFQFMKVPALISYLPRKARTLMTRKSSNPLPFYALVGLKRDGIDKKTGLLSFEDGTYGYMYRVVGNASVLLFEEDKRAIVDRVDAFYRKMGYEAELIFLTAKSAQAVYKQVASLKDTYDRLEDKDPDLVALANEQFDVLKNHVGGAYKAIHQYLIIKGDNREALSATKSVLQSELQSSQLMVKRCSVLSYDDMVHAFQLVYCGKDGGKG